MTGVMQGNWDAVVLAYGLTTAMLCVYLASLLYRIRAAGYAAGPASDRGAPQPGGRP